MAFTSWMICPKGFPSPLISIHAPRTGSDNCTSWGCYLQRNFNPRSPHGERRRIATSFCATADNFNPRSPHGERPFTQAITTEIEHNFNPRSPHGERQWRKPWRVTGGRISIHAPRTGSDSTACSHRRNIIGNFNPRSPHGERPTTAARRLPDGYFNPRSPHGERLYPPRPFVEIVKISIHAPRTGSDDAVALLRGAHGRFQSTLPARGATRSPSPNVRRAAFQSTLPARGATVDFSH